MLGSSGSCQSEYKGTHGMQAPGPQGALVECAHMEKRNETVELASAGFPPLW